MAFGKKEFSNLKPSAIAEIGDTINLLISSSFSGSQESWYAIGATIPTEGLNGNLNKVIENAERIKFRYRDSDYVQGITLTIPGNTTPVDACNAVGGFQIGTPYFVKNWDTYLAPTVFKDSNCTIPYTGSAPFTGSGYWYRDTYYPNNAFELDGNGNIVQWYDCITNTTYQSQPLLNYHTGIIADRKRRSDFYYLSFQDPVKIPLTVSGLPATASVLDSVFFEPQIDERAYTSDYNVLLNNNKDNRSSKIYLTVDRNENQSTPTNYSLISNSLLTENTRYSLDEDLFANIQDSNYESLSWTKTRYEGSNYSGYQGGFPVAFGFTPFEGSIYASTVTTSSIVADQNKSSTIPKTLFIGALRDSRYVGSSPYVVVTVNSGSTPTTTDVSGSYFGPGGQAINTSSPITASYYVVSTDSLGNYYTRTEQIRISPGHRIGSSSFDNYYQESDERLGSYDIQSEFGGLVSKTSGSVRLLIQAPAISDALVSAGNTYIFQEAEDRPNEFRVISNQAIFNKETRDLYKTDSTGLIINVRKGLPVI